MSHKSEVILFLLFFFLRYFRLDRFYVARYILGILKFLTFTWSEIW
ncbi:NINE protein [Mycoplasma phocimorsus]|nr:NINE protein [Mycoplasma phocimorsus]MDJ1647930.1 NINE protein [Mycoplasma phocimorsus]